MATLFLLTILNLYIKVRSPLFTHLLELRNPLRHFPMYALTYKLLGILRIGDLPLFSYDEFIQEQDVPEHKTTIIGSCIRM